VGALVAVALSFASTAFAGFNTGEPCEAPEIALGSAASAVAVLVGSLFLLGDRRRKG
jgi:hypothetical protein